MSSYMRRVRAVTIRRRAEAITNMPGIQVKCETCGCLTFYLMAQEDGSIERFCVVHNHKMSVVNIPDLVSHIGKGFEEDIADQQRVSQLLADFTQEMGLTHEFSKWIDQRKDNVATSEGEVTGETGVNAPSNLDGAHAAPSVPSAGRNTRGRLRGGDTRKTGQ